MLTQETMQAYDKRHKANDDSNFDGWMGRSEVKMLLSLLPSGESDTQKEILRTLLRSAFAAGSDSGSANVAIEVLQGVDRQMRKERKEAS